MHDDVYQMYLDEIEGISPCTGEEAAGLLTAVRQGDKAARERLLEGKLHTAAELAKPFAGQGLPMGDLIQEANIALIMAIDNYGDGDFDEFLKERVTEQLNAAIELQKSEAKVEEEMLARVNVLKDISQQMAEELGREATVEELSKKMKMTEDEIKDIMKLTLDAMSVSPDVEE